MKTKTTKSKTVKKNALVNAFSTNDTVTANGALSHSTTGTKVLDFFGAGGAIRSRADSEVIKLFQDAYNEDKTLALKVLFYLSDVREGQGERKLFRTCYSWLAKNDAFIAKNLLQYIPIYTRFDNVLESLEGTPLEKDALSFLAKQLKEDLKTDKPTLAGKWAPSEQASSDTTKRLASKLRKHMKLTPRVYRKMLSKLRAQINVVERLMCTNEWTNIDYEAVPSRASSIYRKAFKKHDEKGYTKFIGQVEKGEKKINASVLYPYDLVRNYINNSALDRTVEAQWKALPDYLKDNTQNILTIADTSGSMDSSGYYGGSTASVRPIDVAVSLAIYTAERSKGAFKDHFMVFSDTPAMLKLSSNSSLAQRVKETLAGRPCGSTNLQSAFELILDKATKFKVPEADMPTTLLIISDMQFNQAVNDNSMTNLDAIKAKYKKAGYKLPNIVFWVVNSYTKDTPVKVDDKGVCLISGCSPAAMKSALTQKIVSPYQVMLDTINTERYAPIHA